MRKLVALVVVLIGAATLAPAWPGQPSVQPESLKFAVIGDNGNGSQAQYDVGAQMFAARAAFPFELVIMLGDNMYGRQSPSDFVDKFERPYAALLKAAVPFYAALGNHDRPENRSYKGFNMGGERYYTFARKNVRFFVFDTNLMDEPQIAWIGNTLERSRDEWKIAYFHHPLYSDGDRHGSNVELRVVLEPLLVRHRVNVVFSGHEHFYERTVPQKGITYFVEGSSGQLRRGGVTPSPMTASAYADDHTFMLVDITGDQMRFRTVSRAGRTVDSGVIDRRPPA